MPPRLAGTGAVGASTCGRTCKAKPPPKKPPPWARRETKPCTERRTLCTPCRQRQQKRTPLCPAHAGHILKRGRGAASVGEGGVSDRGLCICAGARRGGGDKAGPLLKEFPTRCNMPPPIGFSQIPHPVQLPGPSGLPAVQEPRIGCRAPPPIPSIPTPLCRDLLELPSCVCEVGVGGAICNHLGPVLLFSHRW